MSRNYPYNTKLTAIEVRWIKQAYKKGKHGSGYRALTEKINGGRIKAEIKPVTVNTVYRVIKMLKTNAPIMPYVRVIKQRIVCPNCGYRWYK